MTPAEARLAALEEGNQLGLFSIAPRRDTDHSSSTHVASLGDHRMIIEGCAIATLQAAVPLLLDELDGPLGDPFTVDRFQLRHWGAADTYLLSDSHGGDTYIIYYDQLCDQTFNLVAWLIEQKLLNIDNLALNTPKSKVNEELLIPDSDAGSPSDPTLGRQHPAEFSTLTYTPCEFGLPFSPGSLRVDDDDFSNLPPLIDVETSESEQSDGESPSHDNEELPEFDIPLPPTCKTDSDDDNGSAGPLFCGVLSRGAKPPDVRALERSSARPKGTSRLLPKPIVILVYLNHKPCRALLDCGSLTDFVSTTLVDQLKLKYSVLENTSPCSSDALKYYNCQTVALHYSLQS